MTDIRLSPLREADRPAYTTLYESSFPASERKELDYMLSGEHASAYEVLVISGDGEADSVTIATCENSRVTGDCVVPAGQFRTQGPRQSPSWSDMRSSRETLRACCTRGVSV